MRNPLAFLLACLVLLMTGTGRADPAVSGYEPPPLDDYRFFTDRVMGGVSTGEARVMGEAGERYLRLTGAVSTENRGGFIQALVDLPAPLPEAAAGVVLRVRGNGERYFVHLRSRDTGRPWEYYQAPFETTAQWRELRLPFTAFAPSRSSLRATPRPETVTSLAAVAYGRDHVADLSLKWVGVY